MRTRAPNQTMPLEELRKKVWKHKQEGREIIKKMITLQAHFEKMQEYYEEWEEKLKAIDDDIQAAAAEHGIPPQEVEEYDALDDLLGAD